MTDEKNNEESKIPDVVRAQVDGVLKKFRLSADALLERLQSVTPELEKRLTERVEKRATDQSRVLMRLEEQIADLRNLSKEQASRMRDAEKKHDELREAVRVVGKSIAEAQDQCRSLIEECRGMRSEAGPLFGKKLDAMGSQVAKLADMGERLVACEAKSTTAARGASAASGNCDLLDERLNTAERAIEEMRAAAKKNTEPVAP